MFFIKVQFPFLSLTLHTDSFNLNFYCFLFLNAIASITILTLIIVFFSVRLDIRAPFLQQGSLRSELSSFETHCCCLVHLSAEFFGAEICFRPLLLTVREHTLTGTDSIWLLQALVWLKLCTCTALQPGLSQIFAVNRFTLREFDLYPA